MHQPLIIQHLFQAASLEDVSRERLEAFVEAHPSFGIGHYLLSRKLQMEGADRFQGETQRTCLYFSNPLWLQWLLENGEPGQTAEAPVPDSLAVPEAEPIPAPLEEPMPVTLDEPIPAPLEESMPAPLEEPIPVPLEIEAPPQTLAEHEAATWQDAPARDERPAENVVTVAEDAYVTAGDDLAEALGSEEPGAAGPGEPSAADLLLRSIEEARGLRESLQRIEDAAAGTTEKLIVETGLAGEGLPETGEAAPQEVAPAAETETATPHEEPIQDEEPAYILDEPDVETKAAVEPEAAGEPAATLPPVEPIAAMPPPEPSPAPVAETPVAETMDAAPAAETPDAAPAAETPVAAPATAAPPQDFLFEPYHTIDYFASQGIKLTLEENPVDTLGKQLKSFTEWLKVMRRLPQKDREVVPDRVAEETIQTFAAHSIEGKDVLTETMAEVLAKQGMREKARAVYEKLSLLNPDKRAYFAAKIEQLNIR